MWLLPQCTKEVLKTSRTLTQSIPSIYQVVCYTFQRSAPLPGGGGHSTKSYTHVHGEASSRGPTAYPFIQWRIQGEGQGGPYLPYQTLHLFETEILTRRYCISLFNWLIFLMKLALHFATKLNSRIVQKCNCFWVSSYDLFASARKAGVLKLKCTVL